MTTPILALDLPNAGSALRFVERVPAVEWVKVGLQLFTASGPELVRDLRSGGRRVFLDLKFHDIPNTVARAVESAAELGVDLLTVHASGGAAMLNAARDAAGEPGGGGPQLFAVTLLTSLSAEAVAMAWGRAKISTRDEVRRLTGQARAARMDGVVASVHEAAEVRSAGGEGLALLTPGIRLPGDDAGDQARVATPQAAAAAGVEFLVIGRSVTGAADPVSAWGRVIEGIIVGEAGVQRGS